MKYLYKRISKSINKSFLFKIVLSFLLLSELTGIFIVYLNKIGYSDNLKKSALNQSLSLKSEREASLYKWILENQNESSTVSNSNNFRQKLVSLTKSKNDNLDYAKTIKDIKDILDSNIIKSSKIDSIYVIDSLGKVIVSAENELDTKRKEDGKTRIDSFDNPLNTSKSIKESEQQLYRKSSRDNSRVNYFYVSFKDNRPIIVFVNPIFDELGNRAANVLINVKIEEINKILAIPSNVNLKAEAYLIGQLNNKPIVVAGDLSEFQENNETLNSLGIDNALKGQSGSSNYKNYGASEVIGSYGWIKDLNVALIVELNQQVALSPANRLFRDMSLIVTGLVILMTAICYAIIRYRFQSIVEITDVAVAIADGNLEARFPNSQKDEIGALAIAFNHMLDRLKTLNQEVVESGESVSQQINQSSEILQHFIEHTGEGFALLDGNDLVLQINSNLAEILSISIADAMGASYKDVFPIEIANLISSMRAQKQNIYLSEFSIPYQSTYKAVVSNIPHRNNQEQSHSLGTIIVVSELDKQGVKTSFLEKDILATRLDSNISKEVSIKIRTPITSLLGFLKLTHKKFQDSVFANLPSMDSKTQRTIRQISSNFEIMISEGTQVARSIGEMFPEEGKNGLDTESNQNTNQFLISELLNQVKQETETIFQKNNSKLIVNVDNDSSLVEGNHEEILYILISLFNRVASFNEFRLAICHSRLVDRQVVITIGKVNSSLSPEHLLSIVSNLYILIGKNSQTKELTKGMGLTALQKILQRYSGNISVEWFTSNRDRYRFYVVTLPVKVN
ncbi:HAMP domain-containing protein [Pseudanabaena sp. FACHB-1998]|uniref:HAMP domain-containing protein n=1 Tax=Pseudanabaena sp. FACHB-1998 TaxID=2692858 RepID=UPI0016806DB7|nr:HAMP domain-containing protein [Pseudanabaena sp. FACHB-1998]MBD2178194.1 HAMP domain-containing protein [Pseudanabaena sp. FACHB-1998]